MAAPPKPLPTLQPDRFAVGLFDCCAAPGGCGRCAFPAQSSCVPALCDLACSPSCGACQKGAKSKRVLPLPALVEPSSAFVGLDSANVRAAPAPAHLRAPGAYVTFCGPCAIGELAGKLPPKSAWCVGSRALDR